LRLPENAPGPLFVDQTCIDCDTCRQMAPEIYGESRGFSYVMRQPESAGEKLRAVQALVACPTASIGGAKGAEAKEALATFPQWIDGPVYDCGLRAESSFGATSYLVLRPGGNLMIDSPRAAGPLLDRIDALGGVRLLFLTHRDDVADHEVFRRRLGCERILHRDDITSSTRSVERPIDGLDPVRIDDDLLAIPVPGHTRGHMVLLYGETYLFTGDHLAWSPGRRGLHAFRDACWYSWREQTRSMERLLDHRFEWVLPGHGWRYHAPSAAAMRIEVERCVAWMRGAA